MYSYLYCCFYLFDINNNLFLNVILFDFTFIIIFYSKIPLSFICSSMCMCHLTTQCTDPSALPVVDSTIIVTKQTCFCPTSRLSLATWLLNWSPDAQLTFPRGCCGAESRSLRSHPSPLRAQRASCVKLVEAADKLQRHVWILP